MLAKLAEDDAKVKQRLLVLRRDGQPPAVERLGFAEAVGVPRGLRRQPRQPQQHVRLLDPALLHRRQRPLELRARLLDPPLERPQLAQRRHGRREARVRLERLLILGRRGLVLGLKRERPPQLHLRPRAARLKRQGPLQRLDSLGEPPRVHQLPSGLHQRPDLLLVVLSMSNPVGG